MQTHILGLALLGSTLDLAMASGGGAQTLAGPLEPLSFLVGRWEGGGPVSDTGGRATGVSTISIAAGGRALVRRDQSQLFDKQGALSEGLDQLMTLYPEAGGVRADYLDGQGHVIHYGPASIVPGKSLEFTSEAAPGAPVFRLRYDADGPDRLKIAFMIRPPGQSAFQPIAIGTLRRSPLAAEPGSVPIRTPLASLRLSKPKTVDYVETVRVDFAPSQAMAPHHHTAPVVCIVAEGSFVVKIGGRPERRVPAAGVTLEGAGERVEYFRNASLNQGAALLCTILAADGDAPISVMDKP